MSVSQCRQNYHSESEAGINRQINMELYASYTYQSMVSKLLLLISDFSCLEYLYLVVR